MPRARPLTTVTPQDAAYPAALRTIADPPARVYLRGTLREEDRRAVAVVGARRASAYGLAVAEWLGQELARCGVTVVSGLARGIDAAAHRGALAGGGRTLAV
ncbi:MAG TPA: DNA-processing protein DprA, partial [bacterium]|nr:DNA-processing protein DprA [bacterium]